jgi:hypothetical protein
MGPWCLRIPLIGPVADHICADGRAVPITHRAQVFDLEIIQQIVDHGGTLQGF